MVTVKIHKHAEAIQEIWPQSQYVTCSGRKGVYSNWLIIASTILLGSQILLVKLDILLKAVLITIISMAYLNNNDRYDLKVANTHTELGMQLLQGSGTPAILMACLYCIFPTFYIGQVNQILASGIVTIFVVSWRIEYAQGLKYGLIDQRVIMLGSNETAIETENENNEKKYSGCCRLVKLRSVLYQDHYNVIVHHDYGQPAKTILFGMRR